MSVESTLDLLRTMVWRELIVRYKRSVLGVVWALIDPLINVAVYVLIFGVFLNARADSANYALATFIAVVAWTFLSMSIEQSSSVLMEYAALIRRIPVRGELFVLAAIISRSTTFLISMACGALLVRGGIFTATFHAAALPLFLVGTLLLVLLTAGVSVVGAALAVLLADTAFLLRFAMRIAFYACPIVYPLSRVPSELRPLYELNPMVGILWFLQSPFVAVEPVSAAGLASAVVVPLAVAGLGFSFFARVRMTVAELL